MQEQRHFEYFFARIRQKTHPGLLVQGLVENRLSSFDVRQLGWDSILDAAKNMPHADIVKACEDAAKDAVLSGRQQIRTTDLKRAITQRRRPKKIRK